nr:hypothetical protein [Paenibacillus illinoisensis]
MKGLESKEQYRKIVKVTIAQWVKGPAGWTYKDADRSGFGAAH